MTDPNTDLHGRIETLEAELNRLRAQGTTTESRPPATETLANEVLKNPSVQSSLAMGQLIPRLFVYGAGGSLLLAVLSFTIAVILGRGDIAHKLLDITTMSVLAFCITIIPALFYLPFVVSDFYRRKH